jgi:hypothetical protein
MRCFAKLEARVRREGFRSPHGLSEFFAIQVRTSLLLNLSLILAFASSDIMLAQLPIEIWCIIIEFAAYVETKRIRGSPFDIGSEMEECWSTEYAAKMANLRFTRLQIVEKNRSQQGYSGARAPACRCFKRPLAHSTSFGT